MTDHWATFVYRGGAEEVELVGEMTDWQKRSLKLKPLAATNVKYYSMPFLNDARIEYKFLVNGDWQIDSLNPNRNDNGVGSLNNYFTLPRYKANEWTIAQDHSPQGRVEYISDALHSQRQIRVYLPPQYDSTTASYPTIYFGDGIEYLERVKVDVIVDNLIAAKWIQPLILVCVAPLDRRKEYWMNRDYVDYLIHDVVPQIDAKYRTIGAPQARAIAGVSLGGLIASFAAHLHSDIFGMVFGQSPAFTVNQSQMISEIAQGERKNIKWFVEVGRYEALLESNRRMKEVLESKGYRVGYKEVSAGHNWTHWKDTLADGLIYLFPNSKR